MRYLPLLVLGPIVGLVAGCATQPAPPPTAAANVNAAADVVRARLAEAIAADKLTLSNSSGPTSLVATAAGGAIDPAWVNCPTVWYRDHSNAGPRQRAARPGPSSATIVASLTPSGQTTTARVEARFVGSYLNDFINYAETAPCTSTGVLESSLIRAAEG